MASVEIPKWLKDLPLAPEFRPTDTEFADPIAYISKIEKEASVFGICKIVPPLPKPSKRYVFSNLNRSLAKSPELGEDVNLSNVCSSSKAGSGDGGNSGEGRAVFTTRHQELGQSVKRPKGVVKENPHLGVHKQVWQSGEIYTLEQFELKSKAFAKSFLGMIKEVNPLVIEALFWKAASEKPIYVEYANDVPGSAFGEPEGQFRYFNRRRRKRASYQSYRRNRENSNWMKNNIDSVRSCSNDNAKSSVNNEPSTSPEVTPSSSTIVSTLSSEEILRSSKRKTANGSSDMEGTAGWKLSNSPWNLQVIARSPGSLTRYMPDDIPGVTSPMVYIGMLFSWFAWHVEDHELHSLNFLHTGSPKTWYAVPGDYAFPFEEVIRTQAYGGNIDRLAALTLLGEKTTLLSPEIVISSGIPCCRLVQNPGEFVVTFPRAYHVGFSHGFNCGEAANFGTPQWLQVAKEAAVRRAAMNYLPMLSHQQLLYLLTMSFVSRVPRSMLPGARSSRLRDRQKEERELSVKKAFIEDMLKENDTLSLLLGKDSSYQMVIWNPDLLPCASKESQLPTETTTDVITTRENVCDTHSESNVNSNEGDLFKEMSLYMEALNDLYVDDDDLSCDFQVDSGTLACVACGILGFPFMSVVQPSERAAAELVSKNNIFVQEGPAVTRCDNGQSSAQPCSSAEVPISDGLPDVSDQFLPLKDLSSPKGWNTSSKFLRPRIFCLEHGLQIEELLESKGGANLLIICHSDYQKIKAHATVIAEEINTPFNCSEVSLESATQEDLNLMYLAIDDEDYDEGGKDWTSELGINLRYCVKVRKNSPWKQVHHALALGGLFSDNSPSSDFITIKWQSRRSRSRIKINQPAHFKPGDSVETNKDEVLGKKSDVAIVKKEEKLIHYTRRKYKLRVACPSNEEQGCPKKNLLDASVSSCEDIDMHEAGVHEPTAKVLLKHAPSQIAGSLLTTTIGVETVLEQTKSKTLEESNREQNVHKEAAGSCSEVQYEMKATERFDETEDSFATKCSEPCLTAGDEKFGTPTDLNKDSINKMDETCGKFSEGQLNRDFSVNKVSDLAKSPSSPCLDASPPAMVLTENVEVDKSCNACIGGTLDNKVHQELQTSKSSAVKFVSCSNALNQPTSEAMCKCPLATPAEETMVQENKFTSENNLEEHILEDAELISRPALADLDGSSGIDVEPCPALSDVQPVVHTTNADKNELVTPMELDQPTSVSVDKPSEVCATACAEDLCTSSTLDNEVLPEIPTACQANIDIMVSDSAKITQDYPAHPPSASEEECLSEGTCAAEDTCVDVKSDINLHQGRDDKDHDVQQNASSRGEEPVCCHVTPASVQDCSGVEEGCHARENIAKRIEVCSQSEPQSPELRGIDAKSNLGKSRKRKNELDQIMEHNHDFSGFIRSPCEGLRPRSGKNAASRRMVDKKLDNRVSTEANPVTKRARKPSDCSGPRQRKKEITRTPHKCDLEGCTMSFETKAELQLHKHNRCPYDGCRKRFSSHKYAIIHQRVHEDDRPLKCPWKGCSMSFKWAWARTEHIRVHTGERPYKCKVEGCGLSFRFVSDFSRHRRKTGHHVDSPA